MRFYFVNIFWQISKKRDGSTGGNRNGAEVMPEGRIAAQRNRPQREKTPIAVEKIQFGKDFFIPGVIF